jgi:competence protein ComGC
METNPPAAVLSAQPPVPPIAPEKNPLAVWSLVLGILSPLCCSIATGIPAIITGHIAFNKSGRLLSKKGRGIALAGLILGYLSFVMIPVQAALVLPMLMRARAKAVDVVCFANLQMINASKQAYTQTHNGEAPASLDELVKAGLLPKTPVCPRQGVYTLGGKDENPTCSIHGDLIKNLPTGVHSKPQVEK